MRARSPRNASPTFRRNLYCRRQIRHTCEAIRGDVAAERNQPPVSDVSPPQTLREMFALRYRDILLSLRKRDDLLLICASVRAYDIDPLSERNVRLLRLITAKR